MWVTVHSLDYSVCITNINTDASITNECNAAAFCFRHCRGFDTLDPQQITLNITLTYIHYISHCYLNPEQEREGGRHVSEYKSDSPLDSPLRRVSRAHAHSLQPHWRAAVEVTV